MVNINRPNIFIVGTMKGGTTILHDFLGSHPRIYSGTLKEIHYFSMNLDRGVDWYHAHFSHLPPKENYIDASPTYFDSADLTGIARYIHNYNPEACIIMMARDPIDRAISHFNHLKRINKVECLQDISAEAFFSRGPLKALGGTGIVDYYMMLTLRFSFYFRKAMHYTAVFGDRFMAVGNQELRDRPQATMDRIFAHIGVDRIESDAFGQTRYEHGSGKEEISPTTRAMLSEVLQPDYAAFCRHTGVPFDWRE